MTTPKMKYGWIRDEKDDRDDVLPLLMASPPHLPVQTFNRKKADWIYNQGSIGSCTGHGVGSLDRFVTQVQKGIPVWEPSRLFIYYFARKRINTTNQDSGARIRDAMKVIAKQGVPEESLWGYNISKYRTKPSNQACTEAKNHQAVRYSKVAQNSYNLRNVLAEGYPFTFGMKVYEYMESADMALKGILKLPQSGEDFLGGHCVTCFDYNDETMMYLVMNSWGKDWGQRGWFWMPYDYMHNPELVNDIWTLKLVE